jgi:DNA polymerase-1
LADLSNVKLHYVETTAEAAAFVEWALRDRHTMAVDTETTGLERDARIRLIQFGDELDAWTLRWDRWKGTAVEVLERLKRGRQPFTFHNAPYDVPKIEAQTRTDLPDDVGFSFDWGLIDDTMIMSRLASPTGRHALKSLSVKYVDPRAASMQSVLSDAMLANGWGWDTVPYHYEGYNAYAGVDCILTARLLPELEKLDFDEDLYRTEISVVEACVAMSERGMLVDLGYCSEQMKLLEQEVEDIVQMGMDRHHFKAYGSNQMLVEKLNGYGCYWPERTDKGRVSVEADVLERLVVEADSAAARDLARLSLAYRTRMKLSSTYFRNMLRGSDDEGRVHPDINTLEAVHGRMTVKGYPAMQTLPRGPRVRRGFIATPGHYLLLADYDQIEQRKLAHFCGDPGLKKAIATGDLHTAVAQMIFGGAISPQQRQLAKSSGYAIVFGAGPEKFSHTAGVSVEAGSAFLESYHASFPHVKPFLQKVQRVARERERAGHGAYVTTPAGRRLQMRKDEAYYTLVNYLISGSAADTFKQAIDRLWQTDMGPFLRLPVHDECVFEVPDDLDPEEVKREIVATMEDHSLTVPMTVSASGPFQSWADKYGGTEG